MRTQARMLRSAKNARIYNIIPELDSIPTMPYNSWWHGAFVLT